MGRPIHSTFYLLLYHMYTREARFSKWHDPVYDNREFSNSYFLVACLGARWVMEIQVAGLEWQSIFVKK